jgi:hypothetical protein
MLGLVEVLVQGVRRVDGIVGLGGIFAGELEDDVLAAGMIRQEVGDVEGLAVHNDPAILSLVVFGHFGAGQLRGAVVPCGTVHDAIAELARRRGWTRMELKISWEDDDNNS